MIRRPPEPHGSTPDHDALAAGAEAPRARGGAGTTAPIDHPRHPGVGPEGTRVREVAQDAPPAPRPTTPAPVTPPAGAGASVGGVGSRWSALSAAGTRDVEPPADARRAHPGEPGEARGGPGCRLLVLSAGVDSLYASAVGAPTACHLAAAKKRKAAAAAGEQATVWEPPGAGRAFLVRPHGYRGYTIWATSPAMDVCLGEGRSLPALYLWLQAAHLHRVGVEVAVDELEQVRAALLREPERDRDRDWPRPDSWNPPSVTPTTPLPLGASLTASRVDLYVDSQGWQPQREDFPRFVCRAQRKTEFETDRQMHTRGRRLSGFVFGRGAIVARIYDKTMELAVRSETWPQVIWQGAHPDHPVWRVELQFRRPALKAFRLRTVADVLAARQELWEYGMQWISLRSPNGDTNRSRWPEAPVWTVLRKAVQGSPCSELVREHKEAASRLRLLRGFVGYATSLLACDDQVDDVDEALRHVVPDVRAYLARKGTTFDDVVTVKREQRLAG